VARSGIRKGAVVLAGVHPASGATVGGLCPERAQQENPTMTLRIYTDSLDTIRALRPTLNKIAQDDADLARQMRRALTSIPLNIAEGEGRKNGHARVRFQTAMGSANEVRACLEVADAFGYIEVDPKHIDALDKIARTLNRLH
jgi:four helix bundle protein